VRLSTKTLGAVKLLCRILALVIAVSIPAGATTVRVSPIYPEEALSAGIEGWVELAYYVDESCTLVTEIVAADPEGVFEAAAIRSLQRTIVSEEPEIDWSKVGVAKPSSSSILSEDEASALNAKIDDAGPWPTVKTIRDLKLPPRRIECHLDTAGELQFVMEFTSSGDFTRIEASDIEPGRHLLSRAIHRISFELDDP